MTEMMQSSAVRDLPGTAPQPQALAETVRRVQAEFMEMPGMTLTLPQAARLWSMDTTVCAAVLGALVETGFLTRFGHHGFMRA